ncbi:carboxypeptidase-like regulatory domain-containing protein [Pontimicrobium sp. SW4]|uniref:Carboxypeptidase-like regulatory domain-containing protein n=1 Tax=Pontimicrobium sp. SW4 TaxID=3153519 RepID=A0AAU7BUK9_9FLAO
MKTNLIVLLLICLTSTVVFSQNDNRIEVKGTIYVDRNDKEGVTVFNSSSGKGTVTDKEGKFTIEVALNDRIEFSALQFKDFAVVITQQMIDANQISVFLIEQINKLDQVLILPYNLTGDLAFDTSNIELMNPNLDALYFGLGNLDKFEFTADHLSEIENIAMNENKLVNGIDVVNVFGKLLIPIFKSKKTKEEVPNYKKRRILEIYSKEHLADMLSLKDKDIIEFVYYVEENSFDYSLLNSNKELEFITFMKEQEKQFLKVKYGKN